MHLQYIVRHRAQRRHGTERLAPEVQVQSSHDDTYTPCSQFLTHIHDARVKELGLVDAHHVGIIPHEQDAGRRIDRRAGYGLSLMAHHFLFAVAHIERGFKDKYSLAGKLRTLHPADQFLGLPREHRTADDLYAPSPHHLSIGSLYAHRFAHFCCKSTISV